jgi:hypothetical protein
MRRLAVFGQDRCRRPLDEDKDAPTSGSLSPLVFLFLSRLPSSSLRAPSSAAVHCQRSAPSPAQPTRREASPRRPLPPRQRNRPEVTGIAAAGAVFPAGTEPLPPKSTAVGLSPAQPTSPSSSTVSPGPPGLFPRLPRAAIAAGAEPAGSQASCPGGHDQPLARLTWSSVAWQVVPWAPSVSLTPVQKVSVCLFCFIKISEKCQIL